MPAPPKLLRLFCMIEALTLLTLMLIAVPLKHLGGYSLAVTIAGPVHGLAFLSLGWLVIQAVGAQQMTRQAAVKLMLFACFPFGGLFSWRSLR